MKRIMIALAALGIFVCSAGLALAAPAGTGKGPSASQQCDQTPQAESYKKMDNYYAQVFNGANPRTYKAPEAFEESTSLMSDFYKSMAENTENAANQSSDVMQQMLDQCIAGINMNIFDGGFTGMWDAIVAAIKKKMCNFAMQQSSQYIGMAMDQMQFELPMGLGSVGANTNVLGYTMSSTSNTSLGQMQGVVKSPTVQKDAGFTMFQNGGSIMLERSGTQLPF